jgi:hypothetical protein
VRGEYLALQKTEQSQREFKLASLELRLTKQLLKPLREENQQLQQQLLRLKQEKKEAFLAAQRETEEAYEQVAQLTEELEKAHQAMDAHREETFRIIEQQHIEQLARLEALRKIHHMAVHTIEAESKLKVSQAQHAIETLRAELKELQVVKKGFQPSLDAHTAPVRAELASVKLQLAKERERYKAQGKEKGFGDAYCGLLSQRKAEIQHAKFTRQFQAARNAPALPNPARKS